MAQNDKPVTVSIVMTTYNGEKRILKQLCSLKNQTRLADEVLIFDDGSSDDTVAIVREFIHTNGLSAWQLHVNKTNLGWKRNFMEGMRLASGELIFPCDQDDDWYPSKICEMSEAMINNEKIMVLSCDYRVVSEPGAIKPIVYRKSQAEAQGLVSRYGFTRHFLRNPVPGCTFAVRTSFFRKVERLWFDTAPHDEFLWVMATMVDGACFYNKQLMDYDRYAENVSLIRYKDIPIQLENLEHFRKLLAAIDTYALLHPGEINEHYLAHVSRASSWCEQRIKVMQTRDPFKWLMLLPLWGYYNSVSNCLSDLWLVLFGKFKR